MHPERIGAKFRAQKEIMTELEGAYFGQIADVERKVKDACEAAGIPSYQVAQYINVGRQCYSLAKRFTQATRDAEAQAVVNHWAARGLDGPLLAAACLAGGCNVTEPAAVCYNPCVHGSDKHDETVINLAPVYMNAKIADINEVDTLKHFLDLEAVLGETRKIVEVRVTAIRIVGTGVLCVWPNEGVQGICGSTSLNNMPTIIAEGSQRLQYRQSVAGDDFDLYCLGYFVEA